MSEQWSEWIEWAGGDCPMDEGVRHQVYIEGMGVKDSDNAPGWVWSHFVGPGDILRYRYKLSDDKKDNELTDLSNDNSYGSYTTDELVHAVRGMREEIKRRCWV